MWAAAAVGAASTVPPAEGSSMPAAHDKLSCDAAMQVARSCLMADVGGKLQRLNAGSAFMTNGAGDCRGLAGGSGGVSCTMHGLSAS